MARGSNLLRLGDFNQVVVLDAIRRSSGGVSRVELAEATGLTAQTVGNIVRRLLEQGLVIETGLVHTQRRGKPRTLLRVNATARFSIGVHIDPALVTYVLVDLDGEVRSFSRRSTPEGVDPDEVVAEVTQQVHRLVSSSGVDPEAVLGVGVATPGPIDAVGGVVLRPPQMTSWGHVDLRSQLHEALGFHVLLDKDVTAAATAELWAHGGDEGDFVFCYLGSGVGAGIVMGGHVMRGAASNVGEIGDICVDCGGVDTGFGLPGSLASSCLPQALVWRAQRSGWIGADVDVDDHVAANQAFGQLCHQAYAGDQGCLELLDLASRGLAAGMAVLVNALDVDRVVFGGPSWPWMSSHVLRSVPDLITPRLRAKTQPLKVEGSAVGDHVAAQGAAALVLDHFLTPRPAVMLMD